VFADLNLVEPATVRRIAADLAEVGVAVVDGGIAGDPPRPGHAPTVYLAGAARERLFFLRELGFPVKDLGDSVGAASAVKVCSAAVWQGCLPLIAEVAAVAETFGMLDVWLDDVATHQRLLAEWFVPALPVATAKAARWRDDMAVVARTLESAGASGMYHTAAGRLYGVMERLPVGPDNSTTDVIAAIAAALDRNSNGAEGGER
jgi:3-hydroxyisobutyrate dehydrogenase-like beta-hydroxyacid dehydrogenase